ncbi:ABC transporter permease [Chitinophaga ginsengisegetis]|uniref:ABC transporter permease n=1 Tax=Chitinophaga ginsengisegetis TaxID=393003 RepID=UPI001455443A|nr:ABC transporter permease [Chitinophaga ginsengisegetis]MDR6566437.1 putative ABC transport system permease protein [Chitinophaga ginsengisegetis]MDR6646167.1 putative ABC transport system permease protein [Chitinophaga ginsengisegetis]MDR6651241.1 putative ABC transport system permease protein [Chitinophaga ginsengisegetis]
MKRKLYSAINITGLSAGIACFILLALYLRNEWTYDQFHAHAAELYRIRLDYGEKDQPVTHTALTPGGLAPVMKDFPEVKYISRVYPSATTVAYGDKVMNENSFLYADPAFFNMFSFPLIAGNAATVLSGPNMIVLSETMARKYFGTTDIVGKTLKINNRKEYQVTGVAIDPPANTHLKFDFIASYASLGKNDTWNSANDYTYIQLASNTTASALQGRLTNLVKEQMGNATRSGVTFGFVPESVPGIHLHSISLNSTEPGGDIRYNYILTIIAALLLLIACINFMNLATARSAERGREIGVRKALGAVRGQLFWQFIAESTLISFCAMVLGIMIALVLLPAFNNMAGTTLKLGLGSYHIYLWLAGIFLCTTFFAGTYPALFLSGFRPVQVLKGRVMHGSGGSIRKSLVVFQFAASVFFIICTLVVSNQLKYIQHKKIGLDRSQVLVLSGENFNRQMLETFKGRLLQQSGVKYVSASYDSPVSVGGGYTIGNLEGKPADYSMNITAIPVEKDYLQTMGISLLAGANLTDADIQDVLKEDKDRVYHFFLNETAVKQLGWTAETATGKRMVMNGRAGTIKGVMKDFHFASMKSKIEPIVVFPEYEWFGEILVKTSGDNQQQVIAGIESIWKDYLPAVPFAYHFMDEDFNGLYKSEFRTGTILSTFSIVIILVSCLGLLGLAAFTAEQRTREVGIRKVLGASATSVVALLSKDFIKLVLISLCIASPFAWYAMHQWLEGFAYHTRLHAGTFLLAGAIAIVIALLTVSLQSVKAALMNPVKSLRSE